MTAHTHTPATFFFLSCTQTRALILRFMKSKLALKLRLKTMLFIVWFYTCHMFLQTNKGNQMANIYIYMCVCVCVCVCVTLDRQTDGQTDRQTDRQNMCLKKTKSFFYVCSLELSKINDCKSCQNECLSQRKHRLLFLF